MDYKTGTIGAEITRAYRKVSPPTMLISLVSRQFFTIYILSKIVSPQMGKPYKSSSISLKLVILSKNSRNELKLMEAKLVLKRQWLLYLQYTNYQSLKFIGNLIFYITRTQNRILST